MSRHAARDEEAESSSDLGVALREALARRRAAERVGDAPRRRRGADDVDDARPAAPRSTDAAAAVGWPAAQHAPDATPVSDPVGLGWPAVQGPATQPQVLVSHVMTPPEDPARSARVQAAQPASTQRPGAGWRKAVYVLTRGVVNPGESPAERRRRELTQRIQGSSVGCYRIAVISLKGGVGKTTMSVCLGAVLASVRPDRVIAVDANPDRGTLAGKVPAQTSATIRTLLDGLPAVRSYSDIRRYTSQSTDRLEILASAADPAISDAFGEQDYRSVVRVLEDYYNVVVTDCGTGLLHSAMTGVLDVADQLVVVSTNSVDGANSASATLDWLQAHGHADLVRRSVAVINAVVPGAGNVDQDVLEAHFASRCRAVTRIPHDEHLEAGAEVELGQLALPTRDALLAFAAAVADGIPDGTPPPPSLRP